MVQVHTVKKASISDRLAKLKEKMASVDVGGEAGFWRPESGKAATVRILPPVGDMEFFFQEVGRHYNMPDGSTDTCPRFTTSGVEECPICDLVKQLYKGSASDRDLAQKLRCSKSFWMNVVVRNKEDSTGMDASGPFIWTPGVSVFTQIMALVNNPDYGDISDPGENGVDLVVEKKGQGLKTEYFITTRRKECALHNDQETVDAWLDAAHDLSAVMLTDDPDEDEELSKDHKVVVMPYARLVTKYNLDEGADDLLTKVTEALQKEEEKQQEEEEEKPQSIRGKDTSPSTVKTEIKDRIAARRR